MDDQPLQNAPFDSVWATSAQTADQSALEQVMLGNDKLFVVFVVLLIIWLGIAYFILRTDRRLSALEKSISNTQTQNPPTDS